MHPTKTLTLGAALAVALTGCAQLTPATSSQNAEKAAISTCAAAAAYKDAIVLGAPAEASKAQSMLEILKPYCDASTPPAALSAAEQYAFAWLQTAATPYIVNKGGAK